MRLTLDWDDAEAKEGTLSTIRERYDDQPWELRKSSSGDGWHLIVYDLLNDTREGVNNALNLREIYNDDPKRLNLDKKRWETGSPFHQVLYRRKYMERSDYPTESDGYSTGNTGRIVEQSPGTKAAPERERIKTDTGTLRYNKISRLLTERYGGVRELAEKQGVSPRTVRRWNNDNADPSDTNQSGLRRKARSQGIGHYAKTEDGGKAAEDVKFIDKSNERRTLVEYVDVPLDFDIGEDDREYGLLNIHTGTFNRNHTDQQIHQIHDGEDGVAEHAMKVLSPTNPETGTSLNLDERNLSFKGVSGWTREYDSMNWEREVLDDREGEVYINNLPASTDKPENPENYPIFEVVLWNEDMSSIEWQVIGLWTGETAKDATILKDEGLGDWHAV